MLSKSIAWILIVLLLIQFMGCYPYHTINIAETERIEQGEAFRITTLDSMVYYLTDVEIQESVVRGKEKVIKDNIVYPERVVEIRFEDIKKFEVEEIDVVTPILIVLGIGGIVVIALYGSMIASFKR